MKDKLEEAEEQTALVTKELREKSREFELLKRQHIDAQRAVQLLQVKSYTYLWVIDITRSKFKCTADLLVILFGFSCFG